VLSFAGRSSNGNSGTCWPIEFIFSFTTIEISFCSPLCNKTTYASS
jgi:hypothetical protein